MSRFAASKWPSLPSAIRFSSRAYMATTRSSNRNLPESQDGTNTTTSTPTSNHQVWMTSSVLRHISPTPKANPSKLAAALAPLLSFPDNRKPSTEIRSFGLPHWSLTENGDGIYRTLALDPAEDPEAIISRVNAVAKEMNHHPSVFSMGGKNTNQPSHFCIICTTHQPRGLSMRDVRLAKAINEILEPYDTEFVLSGLHPEERDAKLTSEFKRLPRMIDEIVEQAIKSCDC